jgi:mRNA-degrading endonuclease toxin of MazEF toxin-antitoxin module
MRNYIPDRGNVVWIDMHPQAGHEQARRRPVERILKKAPADLKAYDVIPVLTSK